MGVFLKWYLNIFSDFFFLPSAVSAKAKQLLKFKKKVEESEISKIYLTQMKHYVTYFISFS